MKRRFDSLPSERPAFLENDGTSLDTDSESQQQTSEIDQGMLPLGEQAEIECYNGSPLQIPSADEGFVADKYLTSTIYTPDENLNSDEVYVATNKNSQSPGSNTEEGETYYFYVEEDEEMEEDGNQHDSSDGTPLPPGCLPEDMPSPLPVVPHPFVNSPNEPEKSNDFNDVPLPASVDKFKNDSKDSQGKPPPLPVSTSPLPSSDRKEKMPLPKEVINQMDPQSIALPPGPNGPEEKVFIDEYVRYSPSKTESEDETTETTTAKPKVLDKKQAKQRLMAFSSSKQGNTNSPIKKQNKVSPNVPKNNREKPPNPNKSAGVQEQFRATVSAIEEEKKQMLRNMPNYLLNEKLMNFSETGSMVKDGNIDSMKFSDSRKRRNRRSNSRKHSRSRSRRRSTSKTRKRNKSRSRSKRRSRSTSRSKKRSRSRSKRHDRDNRDRSDKPKDNKEEKDKKTEKKEDVSTKIKELPKDWNGFNEAKLTPGPHFCRIKMDLEDRVKRRDYQNRIKSWNERGEYKPIYNYLRKGIKLMNEFRPRPKDGSNKTDTVYSEKIIKYTMEKPMIMYAEHPSHATEFCMPLKMLLENCDSNTSPILSFIIENKGNSLSPQDLPKEQLWYPRHDYLKPSHEHTSTPEITKEKELPIEKKSEKKDKDKSVKKTIEADKPEPEIKKRERKISLVNDDYLSESDREVKEEVVEEPKIKLDSKTKLVKVRSRWDSDNDYESAKEEPEPIKEEDMEISTPEEHVEAPIITEEIPTPIENVKVAPFPGLDPMKLLESQAVDFVRKEIPEPPKSPEHLVSEYEQFEQFVKAVEMESTEKVKTPESEKVEEDVKGLKVEEEKEDVDDWDQESEDEEKFQKMKMELIEKKSESESEELDSSRSKKSKKKLAGKKKKVMKIKKKKPKVVKKVVKEKKKKKRESDSGSSSGSSDSESLSSEDDKKKKKNKKKIVKKKKKDSESESESDSDDDRKKKKKTKLKKKIEKVKEKGKKKAESPIEPLKSSGKKHKIAKKTEEADSGKKKDKGSAKKRERSQTVESEERVGKKRKLEEKEKVKVEKKKKLKGKAKSEEKITPKKLRRSSSSDKSKKKKKLKKKRESSSSSESSLGSSSSSSSDEEDKMVIKSKNEKKKKESKKKTSEKHLKLKKEEKKKKKVSESESDSGKKLKKLKKKKKKKKSESEGSVKSEEKLMKEIRLSFERDSPEAEDIPWKGTRRTVICNPDIIKNNLDWEESSPEEEKEVQESDTESSWDEKTPNSFKVLKEESNKSEIITKKIKDESIASHKSSEAFQTPGSGVILNENSYHSIVPDVFNSERSLSNSFKEIIPTEEIVRPFQSVSQPELKLPEVKLPEIQLPEVKLPEAELYSPGHTESEPSREQTPVVTQKKEEEEVKKEFYDPLNVESESSSDSKIEDVKNIPARKTPERASPKVFESPVKVAPSPRFINSFSTVTPAFPSSLSNMLENVSSVSENESISSPVKKVSVKIQPPKVPTILPTENSPEREEELTDNVKKTEEKGKSDDKRSRDRERYDESRKRHSERSRDDSRDRDSDRKRRRSRSRERRSDDKSKDSRRRDGRRSRTPEKRYRSGDDFRLSDSPPRDSRSESYKAPQPKEIKGTEFDVAPLKETIQAIPVLTGVDPSHVDWERETDFNHSDFPIENYKQYDKPKDRRSRSRSSSPRRKRRSKSPESRRRSKSPDVRKRSPRRRSISPRKRRSPSPRRRSPPRRRRSSRSPERRRRSRSRSPRKKRGSPRRSRSSSPRRRRDSPRRSNSPKKDSYYSVARNRIPVIGGRSDGLDVESSPNLGVGSPMGFSRSLADSTISDSELNNAYYNREYSGDFIPGNYPDEISTNNLITLRNHDLDEKSTDSPKRLSLDQRIELELGVNLRSSSSAPNEQYPSQPYQEFQEPHPPQYPNTYNCDNTSSTNANNASFYPNTDFNGQFYNGPPSHGHYPQYPPTHTPHASIPPHPHGAHPLHPIPHTAIPPQVPIHPSQIPHPTRPPHPALHPSQIPPSPHPAQPLHRPPNQSAVLQVGNIMEVVPTVPVPGGPPSAPVGAKNPQIMQVGNVLQVVPNNKPSQGTLPPQQVFGNAQVPVKGHKATAVVAPSSVVSTTSPEVFMDPLIKAIQLEREKRKKEREKRKAEREARRRARQLKREAKMMSVEEKLKKSVQYEGLMLGQEVEDEELLDALEPPSPIPVEIITVSQDTLPPAGKGILVTEGFGSRPPSEKKEVKFADGICPGDGTSTSGGEASPPPKPRLPKEKRFKKKKTKTKLKKKVKVHIIRQVIQDDDDEDDDDLSPPPPPPGDPPPVFFAKFPFGSQAQYPVYQTQTTTTTLTTVQFPPQSFQ